MAALDSTFDSLFTGKTVETVVQTPLASRLYLLEKVWPHFEDLVKWEQNHLSAYTVKDIALRTPLAGYMESCDVCSTAIFDVSFQCQYCAFGICLDCRRERIANTGKNDRASLDFCRAIQYLICFSL